jgi:hypothetical protein
VNEDSFKEEAMLDNYYVEAFKSDLRVRATEIQHRMDFAQLRKVERLERALKCARGHLRLGPPASASIC